MARILVWSDYAYPRIGGVELMMWRLLPALAARGHAVEVICGRHDGASAEDVHGGIPHHRLDLPLGDRSAWLDVVSHGIERSGRIAARVRPDVMFLMQPVAMLVYYFAQQERTPARSIYALRSAYSWVLEHEGMAARAIASADVVVACSDAMLQNARAAIPALAARSSAVRSALPMPDVTPAPLPWDPPVFLCLGQLMEHKGFDLALEAFAGVVARHPEARLVIAGDGDQRDDLEALARCLRISESVTFTGWIDPHAVPAVINTATVVLVPSRLEGLPQVAIQAAQMGRPVIGANVGGVPEIVSDGETGLLVRPDDAAALAGAMMRLLEDREAALALASAATRRADVLSMWSAHVDQYDAIIGAVSR